MSQQFGPQRPIGVTIVTALVWIGGVLDVLAGILLLVASADAAAADAFGGTAGLVTAAIATILVGVISIVIGFGLLRVTPSPESPSRSSRRSRSPCPSCWR
ncbi:hypothetical protein ABIQ69_03520 [Agromyces sp. G08B096]|uniref:DUF4190 domain-containing protein n=1 Tax=Agromyces sp. G08B096 TaxID=3156399 RepID=A0AAU7W974_9MICO